MAKPKKPEFLKDEDDKKREDHEKEFGGDADLEDVKNEGDQILNKLSDSLREEINEAQREEDADADLDDSSTQRRKAAIRRAEVRRAAEEKEDLERRGMVLAGGTVRPKTGRPEKPKVEDGKVYKNNPVTDIDGHKVQFIGARPVHDRKCTWDEGYEDQYEHFTQSDHPQYYNAVYVPVTYEDYQKRVHEAYCIKTSEELQLFICLN